MGNDTMTNAQIHLRIAKNQKKRWKEYVDDPSNEHVNITELIRRSVTREINGDHERNSAIENTTELNRDVKQIDQRTSEMAQSINSLQQDITQIRQEVIVTPDVEEIISDVMALLPDIKPHTIEWQAHMDEIRPPEGSTHDEAVEWAKETDSTKRREEHQKEQLRGEKTAWTGEPEEIRDLLQDMGHSTVSHDSVRVACEQLKRDTARVRSATTNEGQRFYWVDA